MKNLAIVQIFFLHRQKVSGVPVDRTMAGVGPASLCMMKLVGKCQQPALPDTVTTPSPSTDRHLHLSFTFPPTLWEQREAWREANLGKHVPSCIVAFSRPAAAAQDDDSFPKVASAFPPGSPPVEISSRVEFFSEIPRVSNCACWLFLSALVKCKMWKIHENNRHCYHSLENLFKAGSIENLNSHVRRESYWFDLMLFLEKPFQSWWNEES